MLLIHLNRIGNYAPQCHSLIGGGGVGVSVGYDYRSFPQGWKDQTCQVIGVICHEEKELFHDPGGGDDSALHFGLRELRSQDLSSIAIRRLCRKDESLLRHEIV